MTDTKKITHIILKSIHSSLLFKILKIIYKLAIIYYSISSLLFLGAPMILTANNQKFKNSYVKSTFMKSVNEINRQNDRLFLFILLTEKKNVTKY